MYRKCWLSAILVFQILTSMDVTVCVIQYYTDQWGTQVGEAQYHLHVILRLRNNITIMYFDRYLSCFAVKIIFANLYKLKIEY